MHYGFDMVSIFVRFDVYQACMKSPLGRNACFCAICLGLLSSDVGLYKWKKNCFVENFVLLACRFCGSCYLYRRLLLLEKVGLRW